MKTKNFKKFILILAIANYRNWLDASPPLMFHQLSPLEGYQVIRSFLPIVIKHRNENLNTETRLD